MSPLCQGRICHTRRCTLSHDRPQDISSTALDNFFLILSLLFSASPPSSLVFFPSFCFYFYTPLISVPGIKGSSGRLSVYLSVHLHLSTYLSRYALYSLFLFSLRRPSFSALHFSSLYVTTPSLPIPGSLLFSFQFLFFFLYLRAILLPFYSTLSLFRELLFVWNPLEKFTTR